MITKIEADKRYHAAEGWLDTYHLFSFANYFDPNNIEFGNVRVFNDDTIAGESGFGDHEHDNMEIVTIVFEGALTHRDSMGNVGVIAKGDVQYMSAGTGVTHAEMNEGTTPVHLYQIWLYPKTQQLPPAYAQKNFGWGGQKDMLVPVASGEGKIGAIPIQSDTTVYMCTLERGQTITHTVSSNRGVFMYIQEGEVSINNINVYTADQVRISEENNIIISAVKLTYFVLIDTSITPNNA